MQERGEPERLQCHRLAAGVRAADHERAQGAEIEIDRNGELRVEERVAGAASRTSSDTSTGAPFQPRESVAERERQVDPARRLDGSRQLCGRIADGGRELPQDPLDLVALRARRLRLAVRELDDVEGLDEERLARVGGVVDDPGHAPAGARLHGEHGPAAAERDELLLQVLAQLARADELLELVANALPAGAELAAQLAQLRRGVVAQVGAVLLDGAVDRLRDRRQCRVDGCGERAEERRRRLVERGARPQRAGGCVGDVPERRRRERAAERRVRRLLAHVADPLERRLERLFQERRSPRRSAPVVARPPPGRATARARRRAQRRSRSPSHARPAPGSPGTPARRVRSGPRARV